MSDVARLKAFVDRWRAARPAPVPLPARLVKFVASWRGHAPPASFARPSAPTPLEITSATLRPVIDRLAPALARERAAGAGFNIMALAGLGRHEVRNAYALARLIDPRGPHGLGPVLLAGLFDEIDVTGSACVRPADLSLCGVTVEHRPLRSERDRVDLVIDHPELLLYIEIKVDAVQGKRQLDRYTEAAAAEAAFRCRPAWCLAYLAPTRQAGLPAGVPSLRWRTLATALRARLGAIEVEPHVRAPVAHLLDHFSRF